MDDQEKQLRAALNGLVEMARANFPRCTDIKIGVALGATAHGEVIVPAWLFAKLLKEAPNG
jgi:uncharacterized protein (DUF111 family)